MRALACPFRHHFFVFFLSPNFHELQCGQDDSLSFTEVMAWPQLLSSTEVKRQWATLVLGWVTASVHYLCLWWLCAPASNNNNSRIYILLLLLLCIYTQRNISIYYRTQSAI